MPEQRREREHEGRGPRQEEEQRGDGRVDGGLVATPPKVRRPLPTEEVHRLEANDGGIRVGARRVDEDWEAEREGGKQDEEKGGARHGLWGRDY